MNTRSLRLESKVALHEVFLVPVIMCRGKTMILKENNRCSDRAYRKITQCLLRIG